MINLLLKPISDSWEIVRKYESAFLPNFYELFIDIDKQSNKYVKTNHLKRDNMLIMRCNNNRCYVNWNNDSNYTIRACYDKITTEEVEGIVEVYWYNTKMIDYTVLYTRPATDIGCITMKNINIHLSESIHAFDKLRDTLQKILVNIYENKFEKYLNQNLVQNLYNQQPMSFNEKFKHVYNSSFGAYNRILSNKEVITNIINTTLLYIKHNKKISYEVNKMGYATYSDIESVNRLIKRIEIRQNIISNHLHPKIVECEVTIHLSNDTGFEQIVLNNSGNSKTPYSNLTSGPNMKASIRIVDDTRKGKHFYILLNADIKKRIGSAFVNGIHPTTLVNAEKSMGYYFSTHSNNAVNFYGGDFILRHKNGRLYLILDGPDGKSCNVEVDLEKMQYSYENFVSSINIYCICEPRIEQIDVVSYLHDILSCKLVDVYKKNTYIECDYNEDNEIIL